MTEVSRARASTRWLLPFLAALFAALAAILGLTTASASAPVAAETRVGAFKFSVEPLDGPPERIAADQRLGEAVPQVIQAVATGVAANAGARMPGVIRAGEFKLAGVPKGAVGTPVRTGKGLEYQIPRGTPELDPRVTSIRVMDPVTSGKYQYPNGYVSYMNKGGQVVKPLNGETLQPSDPLWHIELP